MESKKIKKYIIIMVQTCIMMFLVNFGAGDRLDLDIIRLIIDIVIVAWTVLRIYWNSKK